MVEQLSVAVLYKSWTGVTHVVGQKFTRFFIPSFSAFCLAPKPSWRFFPNPKESALNNRPVQFRPDHPATKWCSPVHSHWHPRKMPSTPLFGLRIFSPFFLLLPSSIHVANVWYSTCLLIHFESENALALDDELTLRVYFEKQPPKKFLFPRPVSTSIWPPQSSNSFPPPYYDAFIILTSSVYRYPWINAQNFALELLSIFHKKSFFFAHAFQFSISHFPPVTRSPCLIDTFNMITTPI